MRNPLSPLSAAPALAALLCSVALAQEPAPAPAAEALQAAPAAEAQGATAVEAQGAPAAEALPAAPASEGQAEAAPAAEQAAPAEQAPAPVEQIAQAAAPVVAEQAPAVPSEPLKIKIGAKAGIGIGNFRNHVLLRVPDRGAAVKLGPALGFSAGLASEIGLSPALAVAPELQYTLYRASYESVVKYKNEFNSVYKMGVTMHSIEIPVMVRYDLGSYYAELGPQLGFNMDSDIYKNGDYYRADMNLVAFGVSAGFGMGMGGALVGVRGHFGLLEYAKDAKGAPWSIQANITHFIF